MARGAKVCEEWPLSPWKLSGTGPLINPNWLADLTPHLGAADLSNKSFVSEMGEKFNT